MRNWAFCFGYKTDENIHNPPASVLPHDNLHFHSVAGKTCSVVSPLPQDFYANFGGDHFTGDAPHDMFMQKAMALRGVLYMTRLPTDPWV